MILFSTRGTDMTPFYESTEPSVLPRIARTWFWVCASVPLYGGIKTINREVGWHGLALNALFAAFLMRFPHPTFSIFASAPLAQTKFATSECQKTRDREVGWQNERLGAPCRGRKSIRKTHREVGWHEIERLAGRLERSVGRKREGHWHKSREVCWQP